MEIWKVLETPKDYDQFLRDWKDKPKGKASKKSKERRCECGAALGRWRQKCDKCTLKYLERMRKSKREYTKKRRQQGH